MTRLRRGAFSAAGTVLAAVLVAFQSFSEPLPPIDEKVEGFEKHSGLLELYVDAQGGKVWLRVPPPPAGQSEIGRYLYFEALVRGLGSNPVGLDRNQLGATKLIALRRVGGRILIEHVNTRYRALSGDPHEARATAESFATSVLWAGELAAEDADGSVLVDFTSFLLLDAHGVVNTLKSAGQGSWSLDGARSVVDLEACLAFPENLEFEVMLTFEGKEPGGEVRATAPTSGAITLALHHSILQLPEPGYTPRRFDPRVGCFAIQFADYAAPLDAPLEKRWIMRHRLEKVDPSAERSRVKEPIVYYVDRGVPEPVRSALLDGARWWAAAFEAAGFIDAFRVELLPENAHPMDARYNVINWVHRATRGWSYGWGVSDPRTGELIKGHVLLGSLRVRQDRLLFEGLAGTEKTGSGDPDDPVQLALARIRQLSAHEVGHTLGIAHNFAASTYGRASVMDYPAPLVTVGEDGQLDFSQAYAVGVGAWDVQAVRYGYSDFAPGTDEDAALEAIVREGLDDGLHFITDADARPAGAAQPLGNLWDNGVLPEEELARLLGVRRVALSRFGVRNIATGQPLSTLEEVLAPLYFMHRYQLDAAAKVVGGIDYRYALRGDGHPTASVIDATRQRRALEVLLDSTSPEALDLPESVLNLLLPRPFGYGRNREQLASASLPAFDALGAATTAADITLRNILQPQRCARLVDQHRRDENQLGLEDVLNEIRTRIFESGDSTPRLAEVGRAVERAAVDAMIGLAANSSAPPYVRARVEWALTDLRRGLQREGGRDDGERAHRATLAGELGRFLERHGDGEPPAGALAPPPGSPIGHAGPGRLSFEGSPAAARPVLMPDWGECSWRP
jgi:hypothetical protein